MYLNLHTKIAADFYKYLAKWFPDKHKQFCSIETNMDIVFLAKFLKTQLSQLRAGNHSNIVKFNLEPKDMEISEDFKWGPDQEQILDRLIAIIKYPNFDVNLHFNVELGKKLLLNYIVIEYDYNYYFKNFNITGVKS